MDSAFARQDDESLDAEFERMAYLDDDSAAREILASGQPIDIVRDDTPDGHFVRMHPDGREELVQFDRDEAIRLLGR